MLWHPPEENVLVPLSRKRREAYYQQRAEQEADALAPAIAARIVAPLTDVLAETWNQNLVEPVAGRVGYQQLLKPTSPSAGADFRWTVTGEAVLWPYSVMCRLTCSAVVGERSLTLEYRDADDVRYLVAGANVTLAASQVQSFCWQPEAGSGFWPVQDTAIAPLPQQMIYPLSSLVLHIGNVQAGDQIDQVRLSVALYPTGPQE